MFAFFGKVESIGLEENLRGVHLPSYDEIQFIREGRGVWTVNGQTFDGSAGNIFVINAGEVHSFKAVGGSPLVQLDIHLSPRFIQENL